ncbi:unnamed protein product, partial [Oppiella nova]
MRAANPGNRNIPSDSWAANPVCYQPVAPGPCMAASNVYYCDPTSHKCGSFNYGGCGGNANQFGSREQCVKTCG